MGGEQNGNKKHQDTVCLVHVPLPRMNVDITCSKHVEYLEEDYRGLQFRLEVVVERERFGSQERKRWLLKPLRMNLWNKRRVSDCSSF